MLDNSNDPIVRIDTEIAELQNDITVALERMQKVEITAEEYKTLVDGYKRKIDVLNLDKEEIIFENGKMQLLEYRIAEVEDILGNGHILEEFDKNVFKGLVQRINRTLSKGNPNRLQVRYNGKRKLITIKRLME